ncbi:MAG TPA: hypothetical protein VFL10_03800, partial [Ornithinibacter sp.]|nr:hypothetical protein [Ornithinibacter sp.]
MDGGVVVRRVVNPGSAVPQLSSVGAPEPVGVPPEPVGVPPEQGGGGGGAGVVPAVVAFRAWLATVEGSGLSDRERVDLVGELERV